MDTNHSAAANTTRDLSREQPQPHELAFRKYLPIIIIVISVLWLLVSIIRVWPFTVDDAYITFRYSKNFAEGYGPNFNPGTNPAEGYTSFLWMLIMTVPHVTGFSAEISSKVIGTASILALVLICYFLTFRIVASSSPNGSRLAGAVVVMLLCFWTPTAVHAVSGMETGLFSFLLALLFYLQYRFLESPTKRLAILISVCSLLTGLSRPEGNLAIIVLLVCILILGSREGRRRLIIWTFLLYVLPGAIYFAWRWWYYGHLFPLPFYTKALSSENLGGLSQVERFLKSMGASVGIFFLIGLIRFNRKLAPIFLAAASILLFFIFPAHVMGFDWRYLYPVTPAIFIFFAIGIEAFHSWLNRTATPRRKSRQYAAGFVFLIICILVSAGISANYSGFIEEKRDYARGLRNAHIRLGKLLASLTAGNSKPLVALADSGAIPYFSGWQTIDTYGLNDEQIALNENKRLEYILKKKPDLIILTSRKAGSIDPVYPWEKDLHEACLRAGMKKLGSQEFGAFHFYNLWLYADPKSTLASQIAAKLH